jgi:hypothetical protein
MLAAVVSRCFGKMPFAPVIPSGAPGDFVPKRIRSAQSRNPKEPSLAILLQGVLPRICPQELGQSNEFGFQRIA